MARRKTIDELKDDSIKYEKKAKTAKEALEKEVRLKEERMNKRLIEMVVKYYKLQNMSTEKEDIINEIEAACKRLEEKHPGVSQSREKNIPTEEYDEKDYKNNDDE